jgi:hypothetical protein
MRGRDIGGMIIHRGKPKYWEKNLYHYHCDVPSFLLCLKKTEYVSSRIQTKNRVKCFSFLLHHSRLPLSRAFVMLHSFSPGVCKWLIAGYILFLSSVQSLSRYGYCCHIILSPALQAEEWRGVVSWGQTNSQAEAGVHLIDNSMTTKMYS